MHAVLNRRKSMLQIVAAMFPLVAFAVNVRADIFQWEYVDPADPAQSKRQSTTLAPDGAGVDAGRAADLQGRNLTMAYLIGKDFSPIQGYIHVTPVNRQSNLSGTNLTDADLTGANLSAAILKDADFTDAQIRGANFTTQVMGCFRQGCLTATGTGISLDQLYSTASYRAHDLAEVCLDGNELSDGNFSRQNLANAAFNNATLTGAKFTNANLTGVHIYNSSLTGADFSHAEIRGAAVHNTGFTLAQLYSTTSYQARDLTGVVLAGNDLSGGNFSSQNLTTANFNGAGLAGGNFRRANLSNAVLSATLTEADFVQANLANADFYSATLTDADFTGAEVRGASFYRDVSSNPASGITFAQLRSTASYQTHDLSGIGLAFNELAGGNFAGQNLTDASFDSSSLTGADFRGTNLTNADFSSASLADADFAGAEVQGATFGAITLAQLYSTASYQAHDLQAIRLWGTNLAHSDFTGQNLTNAGFWTANLTGASFRDGNLAGANFDGATLTDADFSGANVRRASFGRSQYVGTGLTTAQLYSMASYQARDLSGIMLYGSNFPNGKFNGQDLSNAVFGLISHITGYEIRGSTLTGADFSNANLANVTFGSSDLTGANFRQANLTNANFSYIAGGVCSGDVCVPTFRGATLTDADFTGAEIRGANFDRGYDYNIGGITLAQLYSTASYQASDLRGVNFSNNELAGGNFARQNLANANLAHATLTGADFTAADARGAYGLNSFGTTVTNLILPDGHISGLGLYASELLVVRDYDGNPSGIGPIPITVDQHLTIGPGGILKVVFEADAWDSTISFASGIPVALGGTLELTFADDVNLTSQVGRTFNIFDWTGVAPTGSFTVTSPYAWDLTNLYTAGEVTLLSVPEPGSIARVAVSTFSLALYRRRRIS